MREKNKRRKEESTPTTGAPQTNSLDVKTLKGDTMSNLTTDLPTTHLEEMNEMYSTTLRTTVEGLNTPENREKVQTWGSVSRKINIPLGFLNYMTRKEGLDNNFECEDYFILNSPYNREPFLDDEKTFVSKTVYLIRYLYGVADFGFLPVSLISNSLSKPESGIRLNDCLQGKDRGHFMTVFKMMITDGLKKDESFWKKVVSKLISETNSGNETPPYLLELQEGDLMETLYEMKENGETDYSLEDLVPSDVFNNIYEVEETISIRLESVQTHRTEIQKYNNGENKWRPHNFGLTNLTDQLIHRRGWGYNQSEVDLMCSESNLMSGENHLLHSRNSIEFSGYLTEPLMLFVSSLEMDWSHKLYDFLGGISNYDSYVTNLCDNKVTTKDMRTWLNRLERIANLVDDKGYNVWGSLVDTIRTHYDGWKSTNSSECSNFDKLSPTSMDTGLLYIHLIRMVMKEMGLSRGREGSYDKVSRDFVNYMKDLITNDSYKYEKWVLDSNRSWKGRFTGVLTNIYNDFLKTMKSSQGKVESEKVLFERKLREIRETGNLPPQFKMYDRIRTGEWVVVDVDLEKGTGLQLCHYESEMNGGLRTDENTFVGLSLDNNVVGGDNCSTDYMVYDVVTETGGDFWNRFVSEVDEPVNRMSIENQYWNTTLQFCMMYNKLNKNN